MSTPPGDESVPGSGVWLAIRDGQAEITLARSAQRNTLDSTALAALARALERVEGDQTIHGAVLRSAVTGVFCSGGDYVDHDQPERPSPHYREQLAACFDRWTTRSVPVISVVDGAARAFGAALALTSDFTICTTAASFELPELSRRVVPAYAIALLRTRHSSRLVRELVLDREPCDAIEAARRGLIPRPEPHLDAAEARAQGLLARWAGIGADAVRRAIRTLTDIDTAPDLGAVRHIADAGVADQLRRFRAGQADQNYLRP